MAKLRIKGDTSGYIDIAAPDVAGAATINLDKIAQTDVSQTISGVTTLDRDWSVGGDGEGALKISGDKPTIKFQSDANDSWIMHMGGAGDLEYYHNGSGSLLKRFDVSKDGYVTMPYQPISATYANGINGFVVSAGNNFFTTVSAYVTHYLLEGITYNAANGRFTVPTDGKYLITFGSIHRNGTASVSANVNGTTFIRAYSELAGGGGWGRVSMTGARNLSSGDYIELISENTCEYHGNMHSQFVIQMIG